MRRKAARSATTGALMRPEPDSGRLTRADGVTGIEALAG